jgi:hypothetical protein
LDLDILLNQRWTIGGRREAARVVVLVFAAWLRQALRSQRPIAQKIWRRVCLVDVAWPIDVVLFVAFTLLHTVARTIVVRLFPTFGSAFAICFFRRVIGRLIARLIGGSVIGS